MLGTVDVRLPKEGLGGIVTLKFWVCDIRSGNYDLTTIIYEPHRKMPMTAAVFSADGSILAVAAETLITLWDPDKNALVAVIGDTFTPISVLSFVGNSEYLISLSHGSNPQLAVWDLSKLSMFWSYRLHAEAVFTSKDGCQFAVLALSNSSIETAIKDQGGLVLLFDAKKPVPMSTWMVKKAKGGGLAFLSHEASAPITDREIDGSGSPLLVYMNSDHEYVIFDPHNFNETQISTNVHRSNLDADETGTADFLLL